MPEQAPEMKPLHDPLPFRRLNLRKRLVLILLIATIPGILVAIVLAIVALQRESEHIQTNAKRLVAIHAAQHTNVIQNAEIMLDTLVEALRLDQVEEEQCATFFTDWVRRYPSLTSLTLLDANGEDVCSSVGTEMPNRIASEDFFERVAQEKEFVLGEYSVGRTGRPLIIAARPILDGDDTFLGAIAVGIDLRWLEFLARRMDLPRGSTLTAMSVDGGVLNHYHAERIDSDEIAAPAETVPDETVRQAMALRGSGIERGDTVEGRPRIYGFETTESGGLIIAVGMPEFEEFERYGSALRDTLAAPIGILALALIAAGLASELLVTRWARRLKAAAEKMADGDFGVRVRLPNSRSEIAQLGESFDLMAETIERKQGELHELAEQRRALLRELNHRAKNNLQMITSLLSIKSGGIADVEARQTLDDIRDRIVALAEIHRLLYQDEDGRVSPNFVHQLGEHLAGFYGTPHRRIELDLADVALSAEKAITLGLVMNELVANACKHAFPDGREGVVRITLTNDGDRRELIIADNGIPMDAEYAAKERGSLGLRMVRGLVRQLGGSLEIEQGETWKSFRVPWPSS
ncbi:MAG: HAMP domain-containing protein [Salinarimonadaceae bacterium]|nr:MAG: HAMP domain-containing protein [Salinarimonadaceae bacterium]